MILKDGGKIVRKFPFVPGIDFSGKVIESKDEDSKKMKSNSYRIQELVKSYFGGFSQYAKVDSNF